MNKLQKLVTGLRKKVAGSGLAIGNNGELEIVIGGKLRKLKFGLGATRAVCEAHGITLAQLPEKFGIDDLFLEEIYGGLVHALALQDKTPDFKRADVYNWIDEMPQNAFQNTFDFWMLTNQHGETRYEKFLKAIPDADTDEKKNLVG